MAKAPLWIKITSTRFEDGKMCADVQINTIHPGFLGFLWETSGRMIRTDTELPLPLWMRLYAVSRIYLGAVGRETKRQLCQIMVEGGVR